MNSRRELSVSYVLKFLFFLSLFIYVSILFLTIPEGPAGLFPLITLPVIGLLLFYRLLTILFPSRIDDLQEMVYGYLDSWSIRMISAESFIPDESDDQMKTPEPIETARVLVWIALGVVLVYILGHFIGGFIFMLSFLRVYGDIDLIRSLAVSVIILLLLWGLAVSVNLAIWPGKWVEFL